MSVRIINADVFAGLAHLENESVNCCVTSPPYFGLRDYGVPGQIGLEPTPEAFIEKMVAVFDEVKRVLRKDGTLWLNIGDSYCNTDKWGGGGEGKNGKQTLAPDGSVPSWAVRRRREKMPGIKPKDLIGIPWMLAFALRADGWWLRQEIIWSKPNPMPESVRDRCTKAHEHIFLLTKSERYHFDAAAIAEAGSGTQERPQQRRARELAAEHGLTDEHLEALRACGVSDAGKAKVTQSGYGKNTAEVQRLAAEAKTALGGYTREFLMGETRNKRSVWTVSTTPYSDAHFATFPEEIPELCIKAGSRIGDTILDPFGGAGTTGLVADKLGRNAVLIELNPEYAAMAEKRIRGSAPLFAELEAVALKTPEQMSLV
jgi:DNA modification methylase